MSVCLFWMCEFVEDTPESYDDVMTSVIRKGVFSFVFF